MAIVITNGLVVTFDDAARVIPNGAVRIEGDRIAAVGEASTVPLGTGDTRIDARNCLVLPGFTNAHTHSTEFWARGRFEGLALEPWLAAVFPPLDHLSPERIRLTVLAVAGEMLKTGVTTVIDHFRQTPMREEAVAAAVAAYREAGINVGLAAMLRDKPTSGIAGRPPSAAALLDLCDHAVRSWHEPAAGVSIMLGPSAPHRCSDRLLEGLGALAARYGLAIHTHLDENRTQRQEADALYGCSSLRHIAALGLLGPRLSVAHAVWVDAADIALLAESRSHVVHNPISNARLGGGIAPIAELLDHNVSVALGTDGAASNDSQNIIEVMKATALLHGLREPGKQAPLSAFAIASMATRAGGRLTGDDRGVLEPGMQADVVVGEIDEAFLPLNDVYRQLVYAGARMRIRHSVIRGRPIISEGRITTFDEAALHREILAAPSPYDQSAKGRVDR